MSVHAFNKEEAQYCEIIVDNSTTQYLLSGPWCVVCKYTAYNDNFWSLPPCRNWQHSAAVTTGNVATGPSVCWPLQGPATHLAHCRCPHLATHCHIATGPCHWFVAASPRPPDTRAWTVLLLLTNLPNSTKCVIYLLNRSGPNDSIKSIKKGTDWT